MTDSVRNLIMDHVWIFQPDNSPNTNQKNNKKTGHWAQNQASAMTIPVLWPEPYRKWVRWTEEKKHRHGAVNLKDLEIFWMKEGIFNKGADNSDYDCMLYVQQQYFLHAHSSGCIDSSKSRVLLCCSSVTDLFQQDHWLSWKNLKYCFPHLHINTI